jgi:hypothetical protein
MFAAALEAFSDVRNMLTHHAVMTSDSLHNSADGRIILK